MTASIGLRRGQPARFSAKAIALVGKQGRPLGDAPTSRRRMCRRTPPACRSSPIPTTAGTGSEATRFTIITDEATDEKMLCRRPRLPPPDRGARRPRADLLTKPARLTADTGIDSAWSHAIEAYVSKQCANPFSRRRWRCARDAR
jgi:alcohol dehydrogenase class IV